jgi:hypothetical protein
MHSSNKMMSPGGMQIHSSTFQIGRKSLQAETTQHIPDTSSFRNSLYPFQRARKAGQELW